MFYFSIRSLRGSCDVCIPVLYPHFVSLNGSSSYVCAPKLNYTRYQCVLHVEGLGELSYQIYH